MSVKTLMEIRVYVLLNLLLGVLDSLIGKLLSLWFLNSCDRQTSNYCTAKVLVISLNVSNSCKFHVSTQECEKLQWKWQKVFFKVTGKESDIAGDVFVFKCTSLKILIEFQKR